MYKLKVATKKEDQPRDKARLATKGFTQMEGIKFNKVFSLVFKRIFISIMLSIVAKMDIELQKMDVRIEFLHGNLEETIHMEQAEGFQISHRKKWFLLKWTFYDLKKSSRKFYIRFNFFIKCVGSSRCKLDNCVYSRRA